MVEVLPPLQWAQRQFGSAELGDKRRTRRAVTYAAAAAAAPCQSVPQQCGGRWKRTKGAYRLFDQPPVTFEKLQTPHWRQTREAAAAAQVVLWLSDTTTLSFNSHPATTGLGPTSAAKGSQGLLLHSTLAVDVSGGPGAAPMVLGLGAQQVWARDTAAQPEPESRKWAGGVEAVGAAPAGVRQVHVGDAESDGWEAIEACVRHGSGFALRACQDRQVIAGHADTTAAAATTMRQQATTMRQQATPLFDLLKRQPVLGGKHLWVRSRPGRAARWAKLAISATAVTVLAPRNWPDKPHRKGRPRPQPIRCWAVRIVEIDAPAGEEPIEWVILTDEPVTDLAAAVRVAFWYACRWLIEEYHKCLKTGCRMEDRQLESAGRLEALLGILAVVAVRLLQLKHQAKVDPDAPAARVVPQRYVTTLAAYLKRPAAQLTTREFWRQTAQLGGFLGRKGDGDPGWLTLWRGWEHLEILAEGMELAKRTS